MKQDPAKLSTIGNDRRDALRCCADCCGTVGLFWQSGHGFIPGWWTCKPCFDRAELSAPLAPKAGAR